MSDLGGNAWIIKDNSYYSLELLYDGIYLYGKSDFIHGQLSKKLSALKLSEKKTFSSNSKEKEFLEKITLIRSSYELLFAIVDAIVNRGLQRDFTFETDTYARNLRIIFNLLVPQLNIEKSLAYHRTLLKPYANKTIDLSIDGFMAIKILLDSDERYKTEQEKRDFFNLSVLEELDHRLELTLEQYHSDNSDTDGSASDLDDGKPLPSQFIPSIDGPRKLEIERDRKIFNKFLQHRNPEKDSLELTANKEIKIGSNTLSTKFVLSGFRGINHMPLRFSNETRRLYRTPAFQTLRTKIPYYSEAVLMSHFDFYRDIAGIEQHFLAEETNPNRVHLDENAAKLEETLLKLRDNDYILVTGLSNGSLDDVRLFSNKLYFLQHLYSNGIIKFQRLLFENLQRSELLLDGLSAYNPFVSESEAPDHALRYSLGQKNLYSPAALHPHYNKQGRPSFPYIGEIFISLRGAEVFTSKRERHQLRLLEKMYEVNPTSYIGPEIELTGCSWLPRGEVVFSKVIKCPNFSGHWKREYREKYSLTKKQFHFFKESFAKCKNKRECVQVEDTVINYLIDYYSQDLLKRANEYAQKNHNTLIFLDSNGLLDIKIPKRNMKVDADAQAKKMRHEIEMKLKELFATTSRCIMKTKLTTKTLSVYSVSPVEVENVIASLNIDESFLLERERLRTPPSMKSSPRTSSSLSSSSSASFSSGYHYTGSPGTPLASSGCYSIGTTMQEKRAVMSASPYKPPRNSSSKTTSSQLSWNCFDIAVDLTEGVEDRRKIVKYVLDNSTNLEFRSLLAPEIRHAAALTAVYLNYKIDGQQQYAMRLIELFQLSNALPNIEDQRQIEEQTKKLGQQFEGNLNELAINALPLSMHSEELKQIMNNYIDAHERMREAIAACNNAPDMQNILAERRITLDYHEEQILPLEELDIVFAQEQNRSQHLETYTAFNKARNTIFAPSEQAFNAYCMSKDIYRQYVQDYYGNNEWFAFQRGLEGETTHTSMIDIVAKMLNAVIVIYQNEAEIYRTRNESTTTKHIAYDGVCHFTARPIVESQLNSVSDTVVETQPSSILTQYNAISTQSLRSTSVVPLVAANVTLNDESKEKVSATGFKIDRL